MIQGKAERPQITGVRTYKKHRAILKKGMKYFHLESQAAVNRFAIEQLGEQMNSLSIQ